MYATIIGGSGFVGTRLVVCLIAAGYTITIIDKKNSRKYPNFRIYANIREPKTVDEGVKPFMPLIFVLKEPHD